MANLSNEKELENYLFELDTNDEDFPLYCTGKVFRQVNIPAYGIADLIYIDIDGPGPTIKITIVELKANSVDLNAVGQICRYRIALLRYIDSLFSKHEKHKRNIEVNGILVGKDYATGDVCFVVDSIEWLSCYHYDLSLYNGIEFDQSEGWYNKNENFEPLNKIANEFTSQYLSYYKDWRRYCRK